MKSYDKTLTRLILILTKLSNNEKPNMSELCEEFGVGLRTIQRDVYQRLMYFPIQKDKQGRLNFIDGFTLDKSTLDNDEMLLTYLALSQVKDMSSNFGEKIDNIFAKLLNPNFQSSYLIKSQEFEKIDMSSKLLRDIDKAIKNTYLSDLTIDNKQLKIRPYKIVSLNNIWYLLANDEKDDRVKSFLISSIKKFKRTSSKFKLEKPIDEILENVHSGWFEDGRSFTITVKVYSDVAYFFKLRNIFPTQQILEEDTDGNLIVTFIVSHYEDIDNHIKSWLPSIEVLEPTDYREKLSNELEKYIDTINITEEEIEL